MKKLFFFIYIAIFVFVVAVACKKNILNPNDPVTISMWHNYGGIMQNSMDELIEEFNSGLGKEKGIIVNVDLVESSANIQKNIMATLNKEVGSLPFPNITTCYPNTAISLKNSDVLVDLKEYFNDSDLDEYVKSYIDEGIIDDGLYVFPVAKSTEVLFLNKTLFDRFIASANITEYDLSTFEGLNVLAAQYYAWTDSLTEGVTNDGKAFYMPDSIFNVMQVGMAQYNDSIFVDEQINDESENYKYIYDTLFDAYDLGYISSYAGYSSDLQKTGDLIASIGSTAGILYYGDTITYKNNTKESVDYEIYPYPVFNNSAKVAIQRGNGMSVIKSDLKHEYASAEFLKWFTRKENNIRFVIETGYFPVKKDSYDSLIDDSLILNSENENIIKLQEVAISMNREYSFYIPPVFDSFDSLSRNFKNDFYLALE